MEVDVIRFGHRGDFKRTIKFLTKVPDIDYKAILDKHATSALNALITATPVDSGETRSSWDYKIKKNKGGYSLVFTNSHLADSVPVIILLQYGHATRNGTYVQGRDIINPVMRPIFDEISDNIWKEVSSL